MKHVLNLRLLTLITLLWVVLSASAQYHSYQYHSVNIAQPNIAQPNIASGQFRATTFALNANGVAEMPSCAPVSGPRRATMDDDDDEDNIPTGGDPTNNALPVGSALLPLLLFALLTFLLRTLKPSNNRNLE